MIEALAATVLVLATAKAECENHFHPRRAAKSALLRALPLQARDGWEYGGIVYRTPGGKVCVTEPGTSENSHGLQFLIYLPPGFEFVAYYHTHPGDDELSNRFSGIDVQSACLRNAASYMASADGNFREFIAHPITCAVWKPNTGLWLGNIGGNQ